MEKDKRIKKEYKRLKELFKNAAANKRDLLDRLIQNAAFMAVTLEELQEIINTEGCGEVYQNGEKQSGRKATAEVSAYNAMIKNYRAVMDALNKELPPLESVDELSEFRL